MEMLQNFKWINNSPQIPLKIRWSAEPQKKEISLAPNHIHAMCFQISRSFCIIRELCAAMPEKKLKA